MMGYGCHENGPNTIVKFNPKLYKKSSLTCIECCGNIAISRSNARTKKLHTKQVTAYYMLVISKEILSVVQEVHTDNP